MTDGEIFLASIFAVFALGAVAWFSYQLHMIHVLVNNRLTEALNEIKRLGGKQEDF